MVASVKCDICTVLIYKTEEDFYKVCNKANPENESYFYYVLKSVLYEIKDGKERELSVVENLQYNEYDASKTPTYYSNYFEPQVLF